MEQWLHFFVGFGTCLADPLLPSESQAAQIPGCLLAFWELGMGEVTKQHRHVLQ